MTGHVIVVMGPTGSGKGTLMKYAHSVFPDLYETVSCTTRQPRPGEQDGVDYHFITPEAFTAKIGAGDFLEWAEYGGNRYGTLKSEIIPRLESGELVLTEIEVQGVEQLRKLLPETVMSVVYVEAGEWEVLRARALARAPITEQELISRKQRYEIEIQAKPLADFVIDNTGDDFAPACDVFVSYIASVRNQAKVGG